MIDDGWSDPSPYPTREASNRRYRRGCALGGIVAGGGVGLGVLLLFGALAALSSISLRGCEFELCRDRCLDDPTPLAKAATEGDLDAVGELASDAPIDDVDAAAACAHRYGHDDVVIALVHHGAEHRPIVSRAVDAGALPVVEAVLAAGADPQDVLDIVVGSPLSGMELNLFGCEQEPRVERAATDADHEAMARLAIEAGADPNGRPVVEVGGITKDETRGTDVAAGMSPLLRASFNGRVGVVRALLDAGADVEHGGSVDVAMVRTARGLLFGGDADALPVPPAGSKPLTDVTPLMAAATAEHLDIVELLLVAGADPDIASDNRFVALHAAAAHENRAMVDALIAAGANPAPVLEPDTPLPATTARKLGHLELADHLDQLSLAAEDGPPG